MSWCCVRIPVADSSTVEEIGIERAVRLLEPTYYESGTVNGSMLFGKAFSLQTGGYTYRFIPVEG